METLNYLNSKTVFWRVTFFVFLMMICPSYSWVNKVKTLDYYDYNVRSMFKNGQWEEGKKLLDEGMKQFSDGSGLNELMGLYYYEHNQYDKSRFFLVRSIQADNSNVRSKQLLVKVEDDTKNYSSAICYVNELLEVNPYWKGLWLKKINLFRKQNNYVEADRLLRRLYQIYPKDEALRKNYLDRMEESYQNAKKNSNMEAALTNIKAMIDADPSNPDFYNELSDLYLQEGETDAALAIANRGIFKLNGNTQLAKKKVGILSDQRRYSEAIAFIKQYTKEHPSGDLKSLQNDLEEEAAYDALRNDPYIQFGRIYERNHSSEALNYLLNTAVSREYNEDALYYIAQAKKGRRNNPDLMYKEYIVYKRMGNMKKALPILEAVHNIRPKNTDVIAELSQYHLAQAVDLMSGKLYPEAIAHLDYVLKIDHTPEIFNSALNKKYVCLMEEKRYDLAMNLIDSLKSSYSNDEWAAKKAYILEKNGKILPALAILRTLALAERDSIAMGKSNYNNYAEDYETVAVPYIKTLINAGATLKAHEASKALLEVYPNSQPGLLYTINTANLLGKTSEFEKYVDLALQYYPNDIDFLIKQSIMFNNHEEYARACASLRPSLDSLMGDSALIRAFSSSSNLEATRLMKEHQNQSALNVLDSALVFDSMNRELLYNKGLAFEAMGQYDSAHHYEKYYQPSLLEVSEVKRHLNELEYRSHQNEISVDYLQSRFGEEDVIKGLAAVSYSRKMPKNTYTGTLNYAGRDGYADETTAESYTRGGTGIQLVAGLDHKINQLWTGSATLGFANKYFPSIQASVKAERYLKNDWTVDVHAGYRRVETNWRYYRLEALQVSGTEEYEYSWVFDRWETGHKNLFNLGVGATKDMWPFYFAGKVDGMVMSNSVYVNSSAEAKYYPLGEHITSVVVQGGIGTAPESSILNYGLPGSFDRLNTMVGLGLNYLLTPNLSGLVMGTWHTFYNQTNKKEGNNQEYREDTTMRYKNLFNIYVQLNFSF